jgi:hypothetical protein
MDEKKEYKLPEKGSFAGMRRPALASGMKRKLSFEVTPHAHELLKNEAQRRGFTQIMLLELMIRDYCDKDRKYGQDLSTF